jgi:hypothetical protein
MSKDGPPEHDGHDADGDGQADHGAACRSAAAIFA